MFDWVLDGSVSQGCLIFLCWPLQALCLGFPRCHGGGVALLCFLFGSLGGLIGRGHLRVALVLVWGSVRQLVRQLVYTMFISNNHASCHLWWQEYLIKHQRVSKYYENDCKFNTFTVEKFVWNRASCKMRTGCDKLHT